VTAVGDKRRSNAVILILIGATSAVVIAAEAFPATEMRRNVYYDRASCERDYSPAQCQETGPSGSGGGGGWVGSGRWLGPAYAADRTSAARDDPGTGRTGVATPTETSVRGGFGAFGRAANAGGRA
jgi:hypothetical protein